MKKTVCLTNKTASDIAQLAASFGISINECVERLLNRLQTVCQEDRSQLDELTKHLAGGADGNRKNYPQKRVEHAEFETDVVFKDRKGNRRCFYVRATIPLFVHEEELFVQVAGEPEFKLVLRDCEQKLTEHDMENFIAAVKSSAEHEYKKTFA